MKIIKSRKSHANKYNASNNTIGKGRLYMIKLLCCVLIIFNIITGTMSVSYEKEVNTKTLPKSKPLPSKICNENAFKILSELDFSNIKERSIKKLNTENIRSLEIIPTSYDYSTESTIESNNNVDYHQEAFHSNSSIMSYSNLSAEQIEGMLYDYPGLDGLGQSIYDAEQNNGVNAYFILAVSSLESAYGESNLAKSKNNLFGMINCTFQSKESSVHYFGELMVYYQNKLGVTMTPAGINPTYCTTETWNESVTVLMNQWADLANSMY